jgi:hypothetical protein
MVLKVAIVGGGPIGIDAAANLLNAHSALRVELFERGPAFASAVQQWGGHVTLFSQNELNVSPAMASVLASTGQPCPDMRACPTGREYAEHVLLPVVGGLSKLYGDRFVPHTGCDIHSIGRGNLRKTEAISAIGDERRKSAPFRLLVRDVATEAESYRSDFHVVVDASGTYAARNANRLGPAGMPALGESKLEAELAGSSEAGGPRLFRTIPDALGADRAAFAGRRVCLVGAGYSAATFALALDELRAQGAGPTSVLWLTRADKPEPYARLSDDPLPSRDLLCARANALCSAAPSASEATTDGGCFDHRAPVTVLSASRPKGGKHLAISYELKDGAVEHTEVDSLVSLVGFRPESELSRELHVHTCYATEGPMKLAASLLAAQAAGGGGGDCMAQAAPGVGTLLSPEPLFFVLGSKSYGRNPSFLLRVGFEQSRLLAELLKAECEARMPDVVA